MKNTKTNLIPELLARHNCKNGGKLWTKNGQKKTKRCRY